VSLPVVFRELASDDVHDIHTWYEEQQPGLGDRFIAALDLVERLISEHPLSCPVTETSRPRSGYVTPEYPGRTWRT